MKKTAQIVRLVPKKLNPSEDTIESLVYLLQEATAGRLKGLAYGAILADKHYFIETTGEANANPLFTLGLIDVLASELREKLRD